MLNTHERFLVGCWCCGCDRMTEWTNRAHLGAPECPRCGNLGWFLTNTPTLYQVRRESQQEKFGMLVSQALAAA
jgi:hypothetical protein